METDRERFASEGFAVSGAGRQVRSVTGEGARTQDLHLRRAELLHS